MAHARALIVLCMALLGRATALLTVSEEKAQLSNPDMPSSLDARRGLKSGDSSSSSGDSAAPDENNGEEPAQAYLFSQIAPKCTLDLAAGKLTMSFPTWGASGKIKAHTIAYSDRPGREAYRVPNYLFVNKFEDIFSDGNDYPNAALMATYLEPKSDEKLDVINVILVVEGAAQGDEDGVVIYDVYQSAAQEKASMYGPPDVTKYAGCVLDIDPAYTPKKADKCDSMLYLCFIFSWGPNVDPI